VDPTEQQHLCQRYVVPSTTLRTFQLTGEEIDPFVTSALMDSLVLRNTTICSLSLDNPFLHLGSLSDYREPEPGFHATELDCAQLLKRNLQDVPCWHQLQWFLVDATFALAELNLPVYVVLWIFDWLAYVANFRALVKLRTIEATQRSIAAVRVSRRISASRRATE